jgi:DNA-binding NarL/FixJ family response regulator
VLIVDDYEPSREFVSSILRDNPESRIIFQVADGTEAVQIAEDLRPDLILLDIGLPGLNGIEVARRILRLCPDSKILFVSMESSKDVVTEALSTGALGYLLKADAGSELLAAVNSVLLGKRFMSRTIARL